MTPPPGETSPEASGQQAWRPAPARSAAAWRATAVAALLGAAAIGWTAYPLDTGRPGTRITLIVAIATGVLSIAQLVLARVPPIDSPDFATILERAAHWLLMVIRAAPWGEVLLVALLALEALHPARPWHTGILGVAILGYLFSVHLAETGARLEVLRRQLPVIAAGTALLALAIGAAALPGLPAGPVSATVKIMAIAAAVIAAALAIPVGGSRRRP